MYDISVMNNSKWYSIAVVASLSWFFVKFLRLWFPKFGQSISFCVFWNNLDNLVSGLSTDTVIYVYE